MSVDSDRRPRERGVERHFADLEWIVGRLSCHLDPILADDLKFDTEELRAVVEPAHGDAGESHPRVDKPLGARLGQRHDGVQLSLLCCERKLSVSVVYRPYALDHSRNRRALVVSPALGEFMQMP